jgi:hypothetical protein
MSQNEYAKPVEYNTSLNPQIWDHDRLKGEVKGALLRMSEDFIKFVDLPFDVIDIIITGGNVNYNYTSHSDIDLHIVANFDTIQCDREVQELFDTKRLLYKRQYDLTIHNIPVELYIEDHRMPAVSAGAFSIMHDHWIKKPSKHLPTYNEEELAHWIGVWKKIIRHAVMTGDLQACRNALKLLRTYRKKGLKTSQGEFSIPNLVYKSLRNDKVIEGITVLIDRLHDQYLSI